jgi:hypothetical protein
VENKIILVDADGVLLNWEWAFDIWVQEHGHKRVEQGNRLYDIGERYNIDREQGKKLIKLFNESASIGFLPPLRDAIHYVKKLHEEHGYVFHCITSLSKNRNAQQLREMNLDKLFGRTVFEQVVCLATGADKDQALEPYRDSGLFWIEDKVENAQVGASMGLKSIIMEHGFNMNYRGPIPLVKNWAQIYEIITGDQSR